MSDLTGNIDEALCNRIAEKVAEALTALAAQDAGAGAQDFSVLLERVDHLVGRKVAMQGSKNDTRDLVQEIVFSRLRRAFRTFLRSEMAQENEVRTAEWALGAIVGGAGMLEFAAAVDTAILRHSGPTDFTFAGRADFIRVEELLQMLAQGKHNGCLSLEKKDNRLDIWIDRGHIAFLDAHRVIRRVWPGASVMDYHEIPAETIAKAEERHARDGFPVSLTLAEGGAFGRLDAKNEVSKIGIEVLFDFIRAQGETAFRFLKHDDLPDWVRKYDLRLGITPVLLEVSKNLDEWRSLHSVFPDANAPIETLPDMHARLGDVQLGVLEIKMLTLLDGEQSPKDLGELLGLPLFDVYRSLVNFAKEGAIVAPGGLDDLVAFDMSVEESVESAMTALDENDDSIAVNSALDRVLGGLGEEEDGRVFDERPNLDFLSANDD